MKPRIAFLTGQSDPARCALSPPQAAVLAELQPQARGIDCVALNYPWSADSADWRAVPLWRASFANARQYRAALRGDEPALSIARARLLQAPRSLLLVGSCGLSLLDALLREVDPEQRSRIRVIAYGAVGPSWPTAIQGHLLRGHRDWITSLLGPRTLAPEWVTVQTLDCGHLDYLQQAQARAAVLAAARAQFQWLRGEGRDASGALPGGEACRVGLCDVDGIERRGADPA